MSDYVEVGGIRTWYDALGKGEPLLSRSWELVHPGGSGGVYPNFPDPELGDSARAYHGGNLARLARVKATYDPENAFRFEQSIQAVPSQGEQEFVLR